MTDAQKEACAKAHALLMSVFGEDSKVNFLIDVIGLGRVMPGDAADLRQCAILLRERFLEAADILEKNGLG